MDPLDGIPVKILGYSVKTRWQISLNYLIPCIVELLVYISLIVIDGALVYQHLIDRHYLYAWLTLGVTIVPTVITFFCVMISDQWPVESGSEKCCGREKLKFFARQLVNFLLFPIFAIYRFARKVFWCIESLFHDKNTYERHHALTKAAEHSPFELYHFLQSYFHSAPQVILQLYILLREDLFRNYDTAFVQSLSIIFSLVKMAMTCESFQRFESQKQIGRNYPWLATHQIEKRNIKFRRTLSAPGQTPPQSTESEISPSDGDVNPNIPQEQRKTLMDESNNFDDKKEKTLKEIEFTSNITDDDKLITVSKLQVVPDEVDKSQASTSKQNVPDDDLLENIDEIKEYLRRTNDVDVELDSSRQPSNNEDFDRIPSLPPPPRPTSTRHPYLEKLSRLSTFKDMLVFNAENFIKENIPRIPEGMFEHPIKEKEIKKEPFTSPTTPTDETDILLPTRRTVVDGIESDDLVAKFISFLGWIMFLIMRMISLSVFSVFYLDICGWMCLGHYILMLLLLINETRFKVKWQRSVFYVILAYIYIFNLIEFKVKFKHIRRWYVGYFLIMMCQNIAMTVVWYRFTEFPDSWWFEFMFYLILQSGIMSLMCFVLYFFYLKPQDKVFFVNEK